MVLATGVDQCELLGVFACSAPCGSCDFIASVVGLVVFVFGLLSELGNRGFRICCEFDASWLGMEVEKVASARLELGPPFGDLKDLVRQITGRSGRLTFAAFANVNDVQSNEKVMARRDLMRAMKLKAAEFDQVVLTLVQQGEIEPTLIQSSARTTQGYRAMGLE